MRDAVTVSMSTNLMLGLSLSVTWMGHTESTNLGGMFSSPSEDDINDLTEELLGRVLRYYGIVPPDRDVLDQLKKHTNNNWEPARQ